MDQERQPAKPLSGGELTVIRHARFGEMPVRVMADELIETNAADNPPHEDPPEPLFRQESGPA